MHSQSPHAGTTLVVQNVWSLDNRQNQHTSALSGNLQLPPAKSRISVLVGKWDPSQGESSVPSSIHGQNSTPWSWLNNSCIADINQRVTATPSPTQQRSINTPTATLGTSSRRTPAPGITSTRRIVSSPASGIVITPTPHRGLENLHTHIRNPVVRPIITNPLQPQATDMNQRYRQWQLQQQGVSMHRPMVSCSHSIHRFGHSDMTRPVFATGRVLDVYMWKRLAFMSASNLQTVTYTMRRISKALAEVPDWQIIETYWNTAMQQNKIWSRAFEARTNKILTEVCWSNGLRWILHTQTGTRFEHNSIRLNQILFNQQAATSQSCISFTGLNPPQSVWNSLIPFWQTMSIFFLSQRVWKVVYTILIQRRESRKLVMNG